MLTLGIETSSAPGSIALVRDGALLDERPLDPAGRGARSLVGEIDRMLRHFGVKPAGCDSVAVSIGPGSFTGLRVGVVAARTLAWATGARLAAVETFLAIAENSPPDVHDLWITANAQRGELYVGRFRREADGGFSAAGGLSIETIDAFCAARAAGDFVSGPGADLLTSRPAGSVRVLDPEFRRPRAGIVARLGAHAILTGNLADVWTLTPLYLRRSAAEETWEQRNRQR